MTANELVTSKANLRDTLLTLRDFEQWQAKDTVEGYARSHGCGWYGPASVGAGLSRLMLTGAVETFIVAEHPNTGDETYGMVQVGMGDDGAFRYCGEGGDPERAGSSLCGENVIVAVAALAYRLARMMDGQAGLNVYRQPPVDLTARRQ